MPNLYRKPVGNLQSQLREYFLIFLKRLSFSFFKFLLLKSSHHEFQIPFSRSPSELKFPYQFQRFESTNLIFCPFAESAGEHSSSHSINTKHAMLRRSLSWNIQETRIIVGSRDRISEYYGTVAYRRVFMMILDGKSSIYLSRDRRSNTSQGFVSFIVYAFGIRAHDYRYIQLPILLKIEPYQSLPYDSCILYFQDKFKQKYILWDVLFIIWNAIICMLWLVQLSISLYPFIYCIRLIGSSIGSVLSKEEVVCSNLNLY